MSLTESLDGSTFSQALAKCNVGYSRVVTKDECYNLVKAEGLLITRQYLEGVWSVFDQNGDGLLDEREFASMLSVLSSKSENSRPVSVSSTPAHRLFETGSMSTKQAFQTFETEVSDDRLGGLARRSCTGKGSREIIACSFVVLAAILLLVALLFSVDEDPVDDDMGHMANVTAWTWHTPKPTSHAIPWGNIPLGLFYIGLLIGGPLAKRGSFGPGSFLHRRPLKAVRGGLARVLHIEWGTQLTWKELILLGLFAFGIVLKFVYNWTWFRAVGRPQAAGRAMSHTIGLLMGFSFILPHNRTAILWLTGMPKERAVGFHTLCTQSFYWAATLKLIFFAHGYKDTQMGVGHLLHWNMDPMTVMHADLLGRTEPVVPILGVLCWVSFTLLFLTSLDYVRRSMWDVFRVLHLPLVLCTTILALYHSPGAALSWFSVPMFFLVLDKVLHWADVFCKQTNVIAMEPLGVDACRLVLSRSDAFAYVAGQWVGINFLNLPGEMEGHLGRIGSAHPYSICTPPGDGSKFEIVIKSMGDGTWSQKVCDWANRNPDTSAVRAEISGPFGGLQVQLQFFKHVLLVGGGVGVTPLISIFLDLLKAHVSGDTARCKVVLIWAVRNVEQVAWFAETWANLPWDDAALRESSFEVRVFVTTMSDRAIAIPVSQVADGLVRMSSGRPSVSEHLEEMKSAFLKDAQDGTVVRGVAVVACGPQSLMADVYDQARAAQTADCTFSLHRETFVL